MDQDKKITSDLIKKSSDPMAFFDKDKDFVFLYKKTEKLASAVFLVTSLLTENEPIRLALRKKVSDLLSFVLTYKDTPKSNSRDFVYNLRTKVLELVSLIEISFHGGLVSQMNVSVLKHEFLSLVNGFDPHESSSKELFAKDIGQIFEDSPVGWTSIKDIYIDKGHGMSDSLDNSKNVSFKSIKDKNNSDISKNNFKRSNRQNIILGLLKKKKELTIKDISEVIKDCSEKTIQRELTSFISLGILKRVGERRWSKYSLNN